MKETGYLPLVTDFAKTLPFYVATIGTSTEKTIWRPKGIGDHQLLFTVEGSGHGIVEGKECMFKKGDIFYLPPNHPHDYSPALPAWKTAWMTFSGTAVKDVVPNKGGVYRGGEKMKEWFDALCVLPKNETWQEISSVLLYRFLLRLRVSSFSEGGTSVNEAAKKLSGAVAFMEENSSRPLTLGEIAKAALVSEGQLCRLFRLAYSMRPMEFLHMLRIRRAKQMLSEKRHVPVGTVGKLSGFDSPAYFGYLFRKHEGMTPGEYRRLY
ncbi:MAG TPA: hypothetical protein DCY74_00380 [Clostridiales bacterium]|nr:hypothetical protein [Clostridiales bacterium]